MIRRLEVYPGSVAELHLAGRSSRRRSVAAHLARAAQIPVCESDAGALRRLTGTSAHQGVAALAESFRYGELAEVIAREPGPLLLLDCIQDPHNLGALVRTAAAVGMAAVIIPTHGAVGVTPTVEKVAAGAVNDTIICRVANICRTLGVLRAHGYWSVGLVPRDAASLFDAEFPERPVVVLGGEEGLRPLVERTCDTRVTIPVRDGVESLNASVAGAIAMYEVWRRRRHA